MILSFMAFDNFLWNPEIVKVYSSEEETMPGRNLEQIDPCLPWQTTDIDSEWVRLDCRVTGNRKPNFAAVYGHNLTKDATMKLQSSQFIGFGTITATDTIAIGTDLYDYSTPAGGQQKVGKICENIIAATDTNKNWIRLLIEDSGNPNTFLRIDRLFIGTVIDFRFAGINVGIQQAFSDPSERFFSTGRAQHLRRRAIKHVITFTMTSNLLSERTGIRKVVRYVGNTLPLWIALRDEVNTEQENSTQLYYGRFTRLPSLDERRYVQGTDKTLFSGQFEFTEL